MSSRVAVGVLVGLCGASIASAGTVTIGFEGHFNTEHSAPIVRSGFEIGNPSGQEQHFHELDSVYWNSVGQVPSNGTGVLVNDRDTQIFVKSAGNLVFSLDSVDVAVPSTDPPFAGTLHIEGYLNNVFVGYIEVSSLSSTSYNTVVGGSLGNVDMLVFDGVDNNGYFILDNLTLTTIPLPTAGAMGLAGFAFVAMRRRLR